MVRYNVFVMPTKNKKRPVLPAPSAVRSVLPARSRFVIPQFMARTEADYLFIISEFNQLCISKISKGADFYGYHYKKRSPIATASAPMKYCLPASTNTFMVHTLPPKKKLRKLRP